MAMSNDLFTCPSLADPENPDTQSDPYGGVNSVITVDDKGQLTATAAGDSS